MATIDSSLLGPQPKMGYRPGSESPKANGHSNIHAIQVDGTSFALNGKNMSYRFHVDETSGDLTSDHFGGYVTENPCIPGNVPPNGWSTNGKHRRELPAIGKGDFRNPAILLKHHQGHTVSHFRYLSHQVIQGKPDFVEMPATFGDAHQVSTLIVRMHDMASDIELDMIYSVFPEYDAIVRRIVLTNRSQHNVIVERLASTSIDLPHSEYDMISLRGEWTRERNQHRRKVEYGMQGFSSTTGFSSHFYNPFLAILGSDATETVGDVWGLSLVYTGSFAAEVEQSPHGLVRAMIGFNALQLSYPLAPGQKLASPECVMVFSSAGVGSMSRKFHRLYRNHLIKSEYVHKVRPPLLNSWEGLYFDFDEKKIQRLAQSTADLGINLFVLDDGWFGNTHPRDIDNAALGDWIVNPKKFPSGLDKLVNNVTAMNVAGTKDKLKFGIWVEPEMISPKSELYAKHPDWCMFAGNHERSEARNQLVLNLAIPEVQDMIITAISTILESAAISYVKWDHNRAIHESSTPQNYHTYILGMYRVFETLTKRFPSVLWEGCAAGGGRFDPGVLQYFPQVWASDNMDGIDRINIHFGTSVVYPLSTMGAHVGAVPNHCTKRIQSLSFRAHVAMMGGSFGFELNPEELPQSERDEIPKLLSLAAKINPIVIDGDLYRLRLPGASRHPAAMVVAQDRSKAVLFAFQMMSLIMHELPAVRLQGLDADEKYDVEGYGTFSGATLMNGGIQIAFQGDYDSRVIFIEKVADQKNSLVNGVH